MLRTQNPHHHGDDAHVLALAAGEADIVCRKVHAE
jgi:hypothetical protein